MPDKMFSEKYMLKNTKLKCYKFWKITNLNCPELPANILQPKSI